MSCHLSKCKLVEKTTTIQTNDLYKYLKKPVLMVTIAPSPWLSCAALALICSLSQFLQGCVTLSEFLEIGGRLITTRRPSKAEALFAGRKVFTCYSCLSSLRSSPVALWGLFGIWMKAWGCKWNTSSESWAAPAPCYQQVVDWAPPRWHAITLSDQPSRKAEPFCLPRDLYFIQMGTWRPVDSDRTAHTATSWEGMELTPHTATSWEGMGVRELWMAGPCAWKASQGPKKGLWRLVPTSHEQRNSDLIPLHSTNTIHSLTVWWRCILGNICPSPM